MLDMIGSHPLISALLFLTLFAAVYQGVPWTKK